MEARTNCFERLGDDLVGQIFERLLWNPNAFGVPKALQRLRLGAVCRRFQHLVHGAGCLDWEFNRSEDEFAFLRYMLQQRKRATPLTKVALVVEYPVNLAAVLQSIIFQPQDSLEEFYLFLGGAGAASIIEFEYMLLMFQACKQLAALEVFYWTREPQLSQRLLCNDSLPKPFTRSVSELHWSVSELLWKLAADDIACKLIAQAPDIVLRLAELLISAPLEAVSVNVLGALQSLATESEARKVIATVPGCLQRIVDLLGCAPMCELAASCYTIPDVPGLIARLVGLLDSGMPDGTLEPVSGALRELAGEFLECVVALPGCLEKLISLLRSGSPYVHHAAGEILSELVGSGSQWYGDTVWGVPEILEELMSLLGCGIASTQVEAIKILNAFAETAAKGRVIASTPGCLETLLRLLMSGDAGIRYRSTELLSNLTKEADVQKVVMETPGVLQRLVGFLAAEEGNVLIEAMKVLRILTAEPANRKTIAAVPRCLERLVAMMKMKLPFDMLADLAEDMAIGEAIVAVPGALTGLVEILDTNNSFSGRHAAKALKNLAANKETARAIAAVPGSIQKLKNFCETKWPSYERNTCELQELGAHILRLITLELGEVGCSGRQDGTSGDATAGEGAERER